MDQVVTDGDVSDDLVEGDDFIASKPFSTLLVHFLFETSVSLTNAPQARLKTSTVIE